MTPKYAMRWGRHAALSLYVLQTRLLHMHISLVFLYTGKADDLIGSRSVWFLTAAIGAT